MAKKKTVAQKTGKFRECVKFGKRIKELREEKGLTQESFAHKAKIHRTYLAGIESGVRNPSLTMVVKLMKTLKVGPEVLLENQ